MSFLATEMTELLDEHGLASVDWGTRMAPSCSYLVSHHCVNTPAYIIFVNIPIPATLQSRKKLHVPDKPDSQVYFIETRYNTNMMKLAETGCEVQ